MIHPASFKIACDECGHYVRRTWPREAAILATAKSMLRKELREKGWRYDPTTAEDTCPQCIEKEEDS